MSKPLPWPVTKVLDGLRRGCDVEPPEKLISTDHAHDFYVDDRRGRMISVPEKPGAHVVGALGVGHDLGNRAQGLRSVASQADR